MGQMFWSHLKMNECELRFPQGVERQLHGYMHMCCNYWIFSTLVERLGEKFRSKLRK